MHRRQSVPAAVVSELYSNLFFPHLVAVAVTMAVAGPCKWSAMLSSRV
eukprot:SAG31_NODE_6888_length_1860_cov_1.226008_1_plen_47_part_10